MHSAAGWVKSNLAPMSQFTVSTDTPTGSTRLRHRWHTPWPRAGLRFRAGWPLPVLQPSPLTPRHPGASCVFRAPGLPLRSRRCRAGCVFGTESWSPRAKSKKGDHESTNQCTKHPYAPGCRAWTTNRVARWQHESAAESPTKTMTPAGLPRLVERPPDLVLEVASPTTGVTDHTDRRLDYARYAIPEYWRFDPSGGDYYDVALAGDRLVDGVYEPMEVEQLGEGVWRGYSETLGLHVCWEHGRLRFFDSMTESYLLSHQEESARAEEEAAARQDAEAEVRRLRARLEELDEGR